MNRDDIVAVLDQLAHGAIGVALGFGAGPNHDNALVILTWHTASLSARSGPTRADRSLRVVARTLALQQALHVYAQAFLYGGGGHPQTGLREGVGIVDAVAEEGGVLRMLGKV